MDAADFWERVKPSNLGSDKPVWMDFDDQWVDEVRRGLKACGVFMWYPLFCTCFSSSGHAFFFHLRSNRRMM